MSKSKGKDVSVCVIEKGAEVGSHILSGNVFDPKALDELVPGWREMEDVPVKLAANKDRFYALTGASLAAPSSRRLHVTYMCKPWC